MPSFRWNIRLPILTSVMAHIAVASTTYYISTLDEFDPTRREKQIDMVFLPPPVLEVEQQPATPPPPPPAEPEPKPESPPKPKPRPPAIVDPPPAPRPDLQKMLKSLIAYPWSASANCERRVALVRLTVNADGWISAYKIIRSTGYGPVDTAIGDNIRRAPRLPLPAGTRLPEKSEVVVPVAVTLPDCSDQFSAVAEEGSEGFDDDPGPGDGEVDPMGIGSATVTDQESGLGYTDDHGPLDGEIDTTGPGSDDLTDQEGGEQDDPFIQPLECTLFGINCPPDETKIR